MVVYISKYIYCMYLCTWYTTIFCAVNRVCSLYANVCHYKHVYNVSLFVSLSPARDVVQYLHIHFRSHDRVESRTQSNCILSPAAFYWWCGMSFIFKILIFLESFNPILYNCYVYRVCTWYIRIIGQLTHDHCIVQH